MRNAGKMVFMIAGGILCTGAGYLMHAWESGPGTGFVQAAAYDIDQPVPFDLASVNPFGCFVEELPRANTSDKAASVQPVIMNRENLPKIPLRMPVQNRMMAPSDEPLKAKEEKQEAPIQEEQKPKENAETYQSRIAFMGEGNLVVSGDRYEVKETIEEGRDAIGFK